MKKNFKLIITYDGTKYLGWQKQNTDLDKTIQGKLENIIKKMTGETLDLIGSGRTDAGVHARMQVANFYWDTNESAKYVKKYINQYLPEDVAVTEVQEVPERFHSRYNAKSKTYLYRIHLKDYMPVFDRKYVYHLEETLNLKRMIEASQELVGEHDFKGFASKNNKKTTVRSIYAVQVEQVEDEIKIWITANGFLYNMVRIIVGTLLEVGRNEREVSSIKEILKIKDRAMAGETAPAQGLILYEVAY